MAIAVSHHYWQATDATPALAMQITSLVDSYVVWVGATEKTAEEAGKAPIQGRLAKDMACAMPPTSSGAPAEGTTLFGSDYALGMARRLARRFRKQIFLSIDVPSGLGDGGLGLEVEKGLVATLGSMKD